VKLRAKLTIRNDAMISAREKRGWSQPRLAEEAGVTLQAIQWLEWLDYSRRNVLEESAKVAIVLEVEMDKILPSGFEGEKLLSKKVITAEVEPIHLLGTDTPQLMLSSPEDDMNYEMDVKAIIERLDGLKTLPERDVASYKKWTRQKLITLLQEYYLDGMTLDDLAERHGSTRAHMGHRIQQARQVLRHPSNARYLKGSDPWTI